MPRLCCCAAGNGRRRRKLCIHCAARQKKAAARAQNPLPALVRDARYRAKRDGLEFTITTADLALPALCPILKLPLKAKTGSPGAHANSPSIDRRDSSRGYTPDNVWIISHKANAIKNDASMEDLILVGQWAANVVKTTSA
jgi:hypothetical protein